ncbi:MAG: ribonuclease R [Chitinophagales bacterium]|nr:ribonuclease R [Chitinophagales bacterium]
MKRNRNAPKGPAASEGLDKKLVKYFRNFPGKEFTRKQVIKKFQKHHEQGAILENIDKLLRNGLLETGKDNKVKAAGNRRTERATAGGGKIVEGRLDMTGKGFGFVVVEGMDSDIFIAGSKLGRALHKDVVRVQITGQRRGGKLEGKIVEIVKRTKLHFLGTIHMKEDFAFVVPDKENMPYDIYIPKENEHKAKDQEKVIVEIVDWPERMRNPIGRIIETIGKAGLNDIEMKGILIENGFPLEFSEATMEETDRIPETISEEEIAKRHDMRTVQTFTIDPEDAKDFDDALSFQVLENGNYEIGVHIADVSHYVQPGSAMDKDAFERATSVYLVDRVLPMFPEKLSNMVCSLRPHEDKLCFAAVFEIDDSAKVVEVWYGKTVIHSDRRFTYKQAQEVIETGEGDHAEALGIMHRLALKFRQERIKNGSIPFDSKEVRFKLDEDGKPIGITIKEMLDSNRLIEDYMLLANKYVAQYISKLKVKKQPVPNVYRVHDAPDMAKLEAFAEFAKKFGHDIKFESPKQIAGALNTLLTKIQGKPEQDVLQGLAIRAMAKAYYSTNNIGHYGLGFEYYSHFTSPIRRYPDVMVHRTLFDVLHENTEHLAKGEMEEMCVHMSVQERNAMSAERESVKYKQVEYMQDKVGQDFDGIITGVTNRGIFVEIREYMCEGFVSQRDLTQFDAEFDEMSYSITDPRSGEQWQLGDKVRVKVVATNLERRTIDLELVRPKNEDDEEKETEETTNWEDDDIINEYLSRRQQEKKSARQVSFSKAKGANKKGRI